MRDFNLYAITCFRKDKGFVEQLRLAIKGGADIVQLRASGITDKEFIKAAKKIKTLAVKNRVLFIINNRVDIAFLVGADGVHLGQDDMSVTEAREISGARKKILIGVSTHSMKQAIKGEKEGADYISVGPVFSTVTKPDYKPVGLGLVAKVKGKIKVPFVAIGGINKGNLKAVLKAGATRIAVVREICGAEDITGAARQVKQYLLGSLDNSNRRRR
ncbi:MAG: thiamine phosphate synthase [bacterium]